MKPCNRCKQTLPLSSFSECKRAPDGLYFMCRACRGDYRKVLYPSVRDRTPVEKTLLAKAKQHPRQLEVTITEDFIREQLASQCWKCFYTGAQLVDVKGQNHPFKPSLDRKDSSKGYTPDNVVVCSWIANRMKNDMSLDEFTKALNAIADSVFGQRWAKVA